ncbi:MAG: preprotein translocase subunit SecY, partial [Flavobacteriaceae bacterium]
FPGSVFLAIIAVLPAVVVKLMGVQSGWALFYGGTSLLILVGVGIGTVQQGDANLLKRHYDGVMKNGKDRKVA